MERDKKALKAMQSWSLEAKISVSQTRILEWISRNDNKVYVSFSGGLDSTVMFDLVARVCRALEVTTNIVFVDTGLEYPEIRQFVPLFVAWINKTYNANHNLKILRPKKRFDKIIEEYGYPIISKEVSKIIYGARNSVNKKQSYINKLKGLNPDNSHSKYKQRYIKWSYLTDAPYPISNRCCDWIKEKPCLEYEKETKNKPFLGMRATESVQRTNAWLKTGCNSFDSTRPISKPLSLWTKQDILRYLVRFKIPFCPVYGEILPVSEEGSLLEDTALYTTGLDSTGCMFCMFGVHLEKKPNRFQKMRQTHPKQYDYCINRLGCGKVLDYIGVSYA